jgi:indolepyruvate ferredoxin oxidoreductase, beta subunit
MPDNPATAPVSAAPAAVTNIVVAGLGGQGVLTATEIVADALLRAGYDVKKSELHGMSQRGGSVTSDVRFGAQVFSPMVPAGRADCLVVIAADQVEVNRHRLRSCGVLIEPGLIDEKKIGSKRSLNIALLGALSRQLPIDLAHWEAAIRANLAEKLHESNLKAFAVGRAGATAG